MNNQEIIDKQLFKKSEVIDGFRYVRWNICLEYAEETKEQVIMKLIKDFKQQKVNPDETPYVTAIQYNKIMDGFISYLKGLI